MKSLQRNAILAMIWISCAVCLFGCVKGNALLAIMALSAALVYLFIYEISEPY